MIDQSAIELCLSGLSEASCIALIDTTLNTKIYLLYACYIFMTIAAIGSLLELSSKRDGTSSFFKFGSSLVLATYLTFIPLTAYGLDVFDVKGEVVTELHEVSWVHNLNKLGAKVST